MKNKLSGGIVISVFSFVLAAVFLLQPIHAHHQGWYVKRAADNRQPKLDAGQEIIEKYDAALRPAGVETLCHYTEAYQSSGHLYLTRIPGITLEQRNELILRMAEMGVATNVHYKPLPMHTAYQKLGFSIEKYPNAYAQFANEITLPLHTQLTDEQIEYVIACYLKVLKEFT